MDGGGADQEGEAIMIQCQEGGGNGGEVGEEMVTGVHDRKVPTTNINTDNETLTNSGNSGDRGGKKYKFTDDRSSRDGVRPAVIMCPSLQEEIIICHEESSSGSSVVTPTHCVEEEDEEEGESEKVFVTMKSEIFNFPKASYPCFCLKYASLFKENDDENVKNDDVNVVSDVQGAEDSLPKFICPLSVFISDPNSEADEEGIFPSGLIAPKAIVDKTNNNNRDMKSGVRSGVVKISKSETTVYDMTKRAIEILLKAKRNKQTLLELIGRLYSLYNGDGSVAYQWLGRPDIFHEKIVKWMYALGFRGPDKLIDLKATPPWAQSGLL